MLKSSDEFDEKGLEEQISNLKDNSIRDRFLETHVNEATPTLLPAHSKLVKMKFDSLCKAVDALKGAHDAGALARREAEKLDVAAIRRGHSTDVERLERRKSQQEKPLKGFLLKSKTTKTWTFNSR